MKTLLLVIGLFSALLINANCQTKLGNFNEIVVPSVQADTTSCWFHLYADVDYTSNATNAYTNISQTFIPGPGTPPSPNMPANCAFVNFSFTSFFYGDSSSVTIPYTAPVHYNYDSNGNLASSFVNNTIMAAQVAAMNGTQCLLLKQNQVGWDQYLCSINYNGLPLYWVVYGSGSGSNFSLAAFSSGPSRWVMSTQVFAEQVDYYAVVNLNASFPNVVADIYSSCGSGNKNFYSLQVPITVTTSVDLNALLGSDFGYNIANGYVIVKKKGAAASSYISVATPMSAIRSGSNCWSLGTTWDKVLPDMNYCAGGCDVTFILANNADKIFVLKTTGVKTVSNLRR